MFWYYGTGVKSPLIKKHQKISGVFFHDYFALYTIFLIHVLDKDIYILVNTCTYFHHLFFDYAIHDEDPNEKHLETSPNLLIFLNNQTPVLSPFANSS